MFIIKRKISILCKDGEFHISSLVGPGGYSPKLYKTKNGAKRYADRVGGYVVELNSRGEEV